MMGDWELDSQHFGEVLEFIQSVFPREDSLKEMLRVKLYVKWDTIKSGETYHNRVFNLIEWAESEGKVKKLILATASWGSDNINIQNFVENHIENLLELDSSLLSTDALVNIITILKQIDNFRDILDIGRNILPEKLDVASPEEVKKLNHPKLSNWFKCFTLLKLLLEEYPLFKEDSSIFTFVYHLSRVASLDNVVKQALSEWLDEFAPNSNRRSDESAQSSLASSQPSSGGVQAYLMIMVSPEKTTKFRVTGSLLCIAPTGKEKKLPVHLNPESNERGVLTTQNELRQIVAQFIQQSTSIELARSENRLGYAYYEDLIIELFLPLHNLSDPIDQWEITDLFGNLVSLGSKYRLVVRSYDRVIKPQFRNAFYKARDRANNCLGQSLESVVLDSNIYHLTEIDYVHREVLREALKEKIGIRITCPLPKSKMEKILQVMLESGLPMGIWMRSCEQLRSNVEVEINQFWTHQLIPNPREFLEKVRSIRASAFDDREALEQHWGGHLTVLWDDWKRMPEVEPL